MNQHHSVSKILQLIFNPLIGLWNFAIPADIRANMTTTLTLNAVFAASALAAVAFASPIAGLAYVAQFALTTFGFGIDSAIFASITKDPKSTTSSIVHFLTGAVFITAASLVFAFCPNPLIPMLVITLLAGILNSFYLRASNIHSFHEYIATGLNEARELSERAGVNTAISFINWFAPPKAQIQSVDTSVKVAFNNTDLETVYLISDKPNLVYIPS